MEELENILNEIKPGVDFKSNTKLIDDEILTSFDIMTLVGEIADKFNVNLGIADLIPDNFQSMASIYNLIQSKLEK